MPSAATKQFLSAVESHAGMSLGRIFNPPNGRYDAEATKKRLAILRAAGEACAWGGGTLAADMGVDRGAIIFALGKRTHSKPRFDMEFYAKIMPYAVSAYTGAPEPTVDRGARRKAVWRLKAPKKGAEIVREMFAEMIRRRIRLYEVAVKSGVSESTMSRWNGGRSPTLINFEAALNSMGYRLQIATAEDPVMDSELTKAT